MSCLETCATLRIFSDDVTPHVIMKTLDIEPTDSFARDDPYNRGRSRRKMHGWFWSTESKVISTDNAEHVRAIIEKLAGKQQALHRLAVMGCRIDISNYWVSSGQGGPILEPDKMRVLAEMGIAIWWDVYFGQDKDYAEPR